MRNGNREIEKKKKRKGKNELNIKHLVDFNNFGNNEWIDPMDMQLDWIIQLVDL